jgi:hypothetical protein
MSAIEQIIKNHEDFKKSKSLVEMFLITAENIEMQFNEVQRVIKTFNEFAGAFDYKIDPLTGRLLPKVNTPQS